MKSFRNSSRLRTRARGLPETTPLSNRQHSATAAYKALISSLLLVQLASTAVDNAKADAAFFEGTTWKSNFICNLGCGDSSKLRPRAPRLEFNEACKIL